MKFARQLEEDLVPEWRVKYLNYKAGKKYVKAVARAINRANNTPRSLTRRPDLPPHRTPSFFASPFGPRNNENGQRRTAEEEVDPLRESPAPIGSGGRSQRHERDGLTESGRGVQYGSFVPSPPLRSPAASAPAVHSSAALSKGHSAFQLPAPAIRVPSNSSEPSPKPTDASRAVASSSRPQFPRSMSMAAWIPGSSRVGEFGMHSATLPQPGLGSVSGGPSPKPSALRRLFSTASPLSGQEQNKLDINLRNFDLVREREREFFNFLDSELSKIETFYKMKEDQAGQRLALLREQLHEMKDQRTAELSRSRARKEDGIGESSNGESNLKGSNWVRPIKSKIFKTSPNSKALQKMSHTPSELGRNRDGRRDYVRRPDNHGVPYRTAKRKLKLALQEFYRGLELLKSYALLNRTAFRKLNKKYDKAVNARPPLRYMNEKVSKSWFVNSEVLDGHITAVEDLYARYFERGNHKVAAGKLRNSIRQPGDESGSAFRNGLFIGTGAVFLVQGVVFGAELLFDPDPVVREQTSYLLQIYGGYFLMLYLLILFCIDCRIWTANKVSYPFIFEFDPRHHLDWRQLAEFPCFFLLVLGVFMWLNFSRFGPSAMFLYYPVVLIFITAAVILFPAPVLGHRSRKWFAYSHWRLLLAGLYPVEFRDFFLGDIYCSLTYATANVELFFCLYANYWNTPSQCNSSSSRLLGFFSALPPIWRFLQCIRRYRDSGNIFPHLVNGGKYTMSIMALVTLSLFRIEGSVSNMALFITFSLANAIYCSFWDVFMDFSFLQPNSCHFLLRDVTALKQRWAYYVIMVLDPVLRFSWIFYAIFTHDKQHSTIVSFLVAFAEVTRRGMWTFFRVENEHCANVAQYKASRDVPLPYRIEPFVERESVEVSPQIQREATQSEASGRSTGVQTPALAEASPRPSPAMSRLRADTLSTKSIRMILAQAHKQDFVKRLPADEHSLVAAEDDEDDDEMQSENEESEDMLDVEEAEDLRKDATENEGLR